MTISELKAALDKIAGVAGDIEVVLQEVGSEARTVVHSLGVKIDAGTGATSSTVTLEHGAPPQEPQTGAPAGQEPPAGSGA